MNASPLATAYWQYLQSVCAEITPNCLPFIQTALDCTCWDNPQTPLDWNNCGVIALIESEQATAADMRRLYVETAIAAFANGADAHPLCAAHLALIYSLIGEAQQAEQVILSTFIQTLQAIDTSAELSPPGLIYLPPAIINVDRSTCQHLPIVQLQDSFNQALWLMVTVRSYLLQPIFYTQSELRFANLAVQLMPQSVVNNLRLGIANHVNGNWEGLFYLHRAQQLALKQSATLQALHLAYRDIGDETAASHWLSTAYDMYLQAADQQDWQWAALAGDRPFTYVPFDHVLLAVRASLLNITTGVLLATGDWFEAELEFWRSQIQPGMTVIDVGANVGVYTFSAARRVGESGCVLAVEPFSDCIQCLQETCAVNRFSWVRVIAGAASDRNDTARLALHSASELNRLVTAETDYSGSDSVEAVACFTLDSLIEQAAITQVDWLKIDAEGHEMQVLMGSERLLTQMMPTIIYENIADADQANLDVATFLQDKGYQLFRYQPYVQVLIPVNSINELHTSLNVIAIHSSKA